MVIPPRCDTGESVQERIDFVPVGVLLSLISASVFSLSKLSVR